MAQTHIIHGLHAVQSVLEHEADTVKQLWMEHNRRDKRSQVLVRLARDARVPLQRVERELLDQKSGFARHQGVVAEVSQQPAMDEAGLFAYLKDLQEPAFLLVLDGVQDPHNLGACLRTADAAGVHVLIAPRDSACGLTSTVRKVASGAAETVPFVQVTNLARTLKKLQAAGIWLVGTDLETEASLFQSDLTGPLALVLGAEGKGMRRLTREVCDSLVKLPMAGTVQSLNVSVSAGICLYEALRQRQLQENNT